MQRECLEAKSGLLEVSGKRVRANLFSTLGVEPELGRGFLPEAPGFAPGKNAGTIVLSDAVWRAAFDADPSILGPQARIDNDTGYKDTYTVLGGMPPGFRSPAGKIYAREGWI